MFSVNVNSFFSPSILLQALISSPTLRQAPEKEKGDDDDDDEEMVGFLEANE